MKPFVRGECLNCGSAAANSRSLYCGERCRQIAELVRYSRRKIAEGTYERPDIQEAIISRQTILGAGEFYDKRGRSITEKERGELHARANGRCEKCGRPFELEGDARFTVQHTAGQNGWKLEAWCYRCNMDDRMERVAGAFFEKLFSGSPREPSKFFLDFNERIRAAEPLLVCDDQDNWQSIFMDLQYPNRPKKSKSK